MNNIPLWNIDLRQIGVGIGDSNGKFYNWNTDSWDETGDPVYDTHIKLLTSPYPSGSSCGVLTQMNLPGDKISKADSPCVVLFDVSNTGVPVPCDIIGSAFTTNVGIPPTRPVFGFR